VGIVHLGLDLRRGVAEWNGEGEGETVGGIVVMRYGENALDVIDGIKKKLEEIKASLPEGVEVVTTYDRSQLIRRSIATLREKLIEESIVVALVCLVLLWHIRSALVAIITLPMAILLSFLPMHHLQLTSNIMSLGGIAIAIGAMVDSAIIMIENAHKFLERFRDDKGRDPTNVERPGLILGDAVGFAPATIATVPSQGFARHLFASQVLALVVAGNFGFGDAAHDQAGNGRSNEESCLSFGHNFITFNFLLSLIQSRKTAWRRETQPALPLG
jgi:Cu/Ag efflux pump CusA